MEKPSDSKLTFLKISRVLVYIVYAYVLIAVITLIFGFVLLLLGASTTAPFVDFVYNLSAQFLQPFRGMFPAKQITDKSYFSAAGLFAIIFYGIFAMAVHSLINWLTVKELNHQQDLIDLERRRQLQAKAAQRPVAPVRKVR